MSSSNGLASPRRVRTDVRQRAQWLAAFDRSGLSAAAFAREHSLRYTTLCGWLRRRSKEQRSAAFVEVELPGRTAANELVIEWGAQARVRVRDLEQVELAARLLQALEGRRAC